MALSEIEKLERRYADNPQGLTFAPLAEVHRKTGDVPRALELLRLGLALHPDYIPASIVLGRCHFDLGDLASAETAFTRVLALDEENVIALKALADITERLFRFEESERWLHALLAVDRSNDEARDQLGRVDAARRQAETASAAAPEQPLAGESEPPAAAPVTPSAAAADAPAEPAGATPTVHPPPGALAPAGEAPAWTAGASDAGEAVPAQLGLEEPGALDGLEVPPPEGMLLEPPVALEEPVEPLAGLVGRDDEPGEIDHLDLADDFQVETAEDIVLESSGGGEFQVANAAEELLDRRGFHPPEHSFAPTPFDSLDEERPAATPAAPDPVDTDPGVTEPAASEPAVAERSAGDGTVAAASEPLEPAAEAAPQPPAPKPPVFQPQSSAPAPWSAPVAETPRHPEPDLVVTESMAELLLQQGHPAEALLVYRHLETRGMGEGRFHEKIAELERTAAAPTPAPASAAEPAGASDATPAAAPPAPVPAFSVEVTRGQSVQAFLQGILAARLPAVASAAAVQAERPRGDQAGDAEGAPTRPAHDSLSLSSVFGEESTPTPPAVPAPGAASPSGVSYDEFFGPAGASAGSSASRAPRTSDAKSDDLDQFHTWLQNLKR